MAQVTARARLKRKWMDWMTAVPVVDLAVLALETRARTKTEENG